MQMKKSYLIIANTIGDKESIDAAEKLIAKTKTIPLVIYMIIFFAFLNVVSYLIDGAPFHKEHPTTCVNSFHRHVATYVC